MSGVVGALQLSDPTRFHRARGDRSAVRAYALLSDDGSSREIVEPLLDFSVDHIPGVWLTNVAGFTLNEAGYGRRQDIKPDNFLGTRVGAILAEQGMADAGANDQATAVGRLFRRVLALASDNLGTEPFPLEETLAHSIRRRYFKAPRTLDLQPEVRYALASATQGSTFSGGGPRADEARLFSLRHHRPTYAARLMECQVPYGEWSEIPVPRNAERAIAWARDLLETRPLLLKVEVNFHGDRAHDLALLSNMGSGAASVMGERGRAANTRDWVAGPEFLVLSRLAHVKIRGVLAADRYVANPWTGFSGMASEIGPASAPMSLRCGPLMLRGRQLTDYATGLLAESCAFALAASRDPDPVGAWIISQDRAACLMSAAELLRVAPEAGVHVSGFTRGRIWIKVPSIDISAEDIFTTVAELCVETRLIPPVLPSPGSRRAAIAHEVTQAATQPDRPDLELYTLARAILGTHTPLGAPAC